MNIGVLKTDWLGTLPESSLAESQGDCTVKINITHGDAAIINNRTNELIGHCMITRPAINNAVTYETDGLNGCLNQWDSPDWTSPQSKTRWKAQDRLNPLHGQKVLELAEINHPKLGKAAWCVHGWKTIAGRAESYGCLRFPSWVMECLAKFCNPRMKFVVTDDPVQTYQKQKWVNGQLETHAVVDLAEDSPYHNLQKVITAKGRTIATNPTRLTVAGVKQHIRQDFGGLIDMNSPDLTATIEKAIRQARKINTDSRERVRKVELDLGVI